MTAIELIDEAGTEPTLDELARRARRVAALEAPCEADLKEWVRFWRADRVAWKNKKEVE